MNELQNKYKSLGGGGGLFLKLNDGDTVKVRITSDPVYFDNEFKGDLTSRIAWVVWNHDEKKPQIWATNGATYNSIKDLVGDEEYGDPTEYDIKITRTGTMQQTRYSVRPGTKRYSLEDSELKACQAIDPIEVISRSATAQHVMWMEEHREEKSGYEKAKAVAEGIRDKESEDEVIEEIDENEPINLDDIPF